MSKVYVSRLAAAPLIEYVKSKGLQVVIEDGHGSKADVHIRTHADLYRCQLGLLADAQVASVDRCKVCAPYPGEAIYNAVITGQYLIHNLRITSPDLLQLADEHSLTRIHVAQGYSRCSCLPVTDSSFITGDTGMAKALEGAGCDVLLVSDDKIRLSGYAHGFIGGCAGNLLIAGQPTLLFNGDLTGHPDCEKITAFAQDRDYHVVSFSGHPLEDIGSILFEY